MNGLGQFAILLKEGVLRLVLQIQQMEMSVVSPGAAWLVNLDVQVI